MNVSIDIAPCFVCLHYTRRVLRVVGRFVALSRAFLSVSRECISYDQALITGSYQDCVNQDVKAPRRRH